MACMGISQCRYVGLVQSSAFSAHVMFVQRNAQNLNAGAPNSRGVFGRMITALGEQTDPYKRKMYSTNGNMKIMEGAGVTQTTIIDKNAAAGVVRFIQHDNWAEKIQSMLTDQDPLSAFANKYKSDTMSAINTTQELADILGDVTLTETFPQTSSYGEGTNMMSIQLKQIAKIMKSRSVLESERDVFVLEHGGYDTHFEQKARLKVLFRDQQAALDAFVKELKAQGIWDNTVIVPMSDFSRSLKNNGAGTDHGMYALLDP